jgi:antitoxin VapB
MLCDDPGQSPETASDQRLALRLKPAHEWHMLTPYAISWVAMTTRHASLFRNGRNQAVRIPREFEIEGSEVLIHKEGDRLVLTPVRKHPLADLLAGWEPLPEGVPEAEDTPPQDREPL